SSLHEYTPSNLRKYFILPAGVCMSTSPDEGFGEPRPEAVLVRPRMFATPSLLVLVLICFFLPWLNVGCYGPKNEVIVIATQSGSQAAIGEFTEGEDIQKLKDPNFKPNDEMAIVGGATKDIVNKKSTQNEKPAKAPMLLAYFALLLIGIIAGFGLRASQLR